MHRPDIQQKLKVDRLYTKTPKTQESAQDLNHTPRVPRSQKSNIILGKPIDSNNEDLVKPQMTSNIVLSTAHSQTRTTFYRTNTTSYDTRKQRDSLDNNNNIQQQQQMFQQSFSQTGQNFKKSQNKVDSMTQYSSNGFKLLGNRQSQMQRDQVSEEQSVFNANSLQQKNDNNNNININDNLSQQQQYNVGGNNCKFIINMQQDGYHNFNSTIIQDPYITNFRSKTSQGNKPFLHSREKNSYNDMVQTLYNEKKKGKNDDEIPQKYSQLGSKLMAQSDQNRQHYKQQQQQTPQYSSTIYQIDYNASSQRRRPSSQQQSPLTFTQNQLDYIIPTQNLQKTEQQSASKTPGKTFNFSSNSTQYQQNKHQNSLMKALGKKSGQQFFQESLKTTSTQSAFGKKFGFYEDESCTKQTKQLLDSYKQQKIQKQLEKERGIYQRVSWQSFLVIKDENLVQAKNKIQLQYCYHSFCTEQKTLRQKELEQKLEKLQNVLKKKLRIAENQKVYLYYASGKNIQSSFLDPEETVVIVSFNPGFQGILDQEKYGVLLEKIMPKLEHNVLLQRKLCRNQDAEVNELEEPVFNKKYRQNYKLTKELMKDTQKIQNKTSNVIKKIQKSSKLKAQEDELALPTLQFKNHSLVQPFRDHLSPLQSSENIFTSRNQRATNSKIESYEKILNKKYNSTINGIINVLKQDDENDNNENKNNNNIEKKSNDLNLNSQQLETFYNELKKQPGPLTKVINKQVNQKKQLKLNTVSPTQSLHSLRTQFSERPQEIKHGNYDWDNILKSEYLQSEEVININQKIKDLNKIDKHYEEEIGEIKFSNLEEYKENRYQIKKREPLDKISRLLKGRSKIQILAEQMGLFKNQAPVQHVTLYSNNVSPVVTDREKGKKQSEKVVKIQDCKKDNNSSSEYSSSLGDDVDEEDSEDYSSSENDDKVEMGDANSQQVLDKIGKKSEKNNKKSLQDGFHIVENSQHKMTICDLELANQIKQMQEQEELAQKMLSSLKSNQKNKKPAPFGFGSIRSKNQSSADSKQVRQQIPEILDKVIEVQQGSPAIKPIMSNSSQQYNWTSMKKSPANDPSNIYNFENVDGIDQDEEGILGSNRELASTVKKNHNQSITSIMHKRQKSDQQVPPSSARGGYSTFRDDKEQDNNNNEDEEQDESIPLIDRFQIDFPEDGEEQGNLLKQNIKYLENKKEILRQIGKLNVNLQELNIPKILKQIPDYFKDMNKKSDEPTTFTRNDIHQMYILYKALHEVTSQRYTRDYNIKDGVDYETYRNGIYQVYMQSEQVAQRIFNIIDYNFSGFMDWEEFLKLIVSIRAKTLSEKINLFIKIADEDGNGSLSWDEIYDLAKICLSKFIVNNEDGFLDMLCEYYTKLIFETVRIPLEEEIPLELIKQTIINGKNAEGDLLCMFCGADI